MRLKKVHIRNYRSIVDSTTVEVEDGVTVVIGKNEQGKTTFLNAIRAFNTTQHFSPNDLPNHLRPDLEDRNPAEIPMITVWYTLEPEDHEQLATSILNIEDAVLLKATKHYDNHYTYAITNNDNTERPVEPPPRDLTTQHERIRRIAAALNNQLTAHAERLTTFASNKDTFQQLTTALAGANPTNQAEADDAIRTFTTTIKTLAGQDQLIIDDITSATKDLDTIKEVISSQAHADPSRTLQETLPFFTLHSTTSDHIPNEVNVADFVANPDSTSKGMANLCRAAGLTIQKIKELAATSDAAHREVYEDRYKSNISGGLNEFWTQAEYHVHFRIEKERLYVSISDGTYTQRIPPSERSEGFRWYLSFYATLLNDVGVAKTTILLLDNPGLELHLDGQRDIKRFLEEKIAPTSQVIYVTHSPAMIDPFNLQQVRAVDLQQQHGTKIRQFTAKEGADADLLEPVRSAMGMSLVNSLILNEWNVLVEGAADKPLVEGIFYEHYKEHQNNVLVNGSLAEDKDAFLVSFYQRAQLPYAVLLDADSSGRTIEKQLRQHRIPGERIIGLKTVFPKRTNDFELEDIISAPFYHQAVQESYPKCGIDQPAAAAKKRTTQYEDLFRTTLKIGFNKRRVADTIKKLLSEHKEDQETRDNLGMLSTAIINCLKTQTTVPAQQPTPAVDAKKAGE